MHRLTYEIIINSSKTPILTCDTLAEVQEELTNLNEISQRNWGFHKYSYRTKLEPIVSSGGKSYVNFYKAH